MRKWNHINAAHARFFAVSKWYIFFAIAEGELCGETASDEESIFMWWVMIHKPHILTENGHKTLANQIPIGAVEHIWTISTSEFFEATSVAHANSKHGSFTRRHTLRVS